MSLPVAALLLRNDHPNDLEGIVSRFATEHFPDREVSTTLSRELPTGLSDEIVAHLTNGARQLPEYTYLIMRPTT